MGEVVPFPDPASLDKEAGEAMEFADRIKGLIIEDISKQYGLEEDTLIPTAAFGRAVVALAANLAFWVVMAEAAGFTERSAYELLAEYIQEFRGDD